MINASELIDRLRSEIDEIDDEILKLLSKRFARVREIGRAKARSARAIADPEREKHLFRRLDKKNKQNQMAQEFVHSIWRQILNESYRQQADEN